MAGMTVAELVARLRADTGSFHRGLSMASRDLDRFEGAAGKASAALDRAEAAAGAFAGILVTSVIGAMSGVVSTGIEMNAMLEKSTLQFRTFMKDTERAEAHVRSLFEFAKATPFETGPIIQASRYLQQFGGTALNTEETLRLVGDAAAATSQSIDLLSYYVGRFYANASAGSALGEELERFREMGVLTPQVSAQLRELSESGNVSAETFEILREALGRFTGAMKDQANTWEGLSSTLKDALGLGKAEMFKPMFEAMKELMRSLIALTESPVWQRILDIGTGVFEKIGGFIVLLADKIKGLTEGGGFDVLLSNITEFYSVAKPILTVMGAVMSGMAARFAASLPLIGPVFNALGFALTPLTGLLFGLMAANEDLRRSVINAGKAFLGAFLPALREARDILTAAFGDSVSDIANKVGSLAPIGQAVGEALGAIVVAAAKLAPVFVQVAGVLARVGAGLSYIALDLLPPFLDIVVGVTTWVSKFAEKLGPVGDALIFWGLAQSGLLAKLPLVGGLISKLIPLIGRLNVVLRANPWLAVAASLVYFTQKMGVLSDVVSAASTMVGDSFAAIGDQIGDVVGAVVRLPSIFGSAMMGVLNAIIAPIAAIMDSLSYLNPFQRHSPSLVDQVIAGTELIAQRYSGLASNLIPRLRTMQSAFAAFNAAAVPIENARSGRERQQVVEAFGGTNPGALSAFDELSRQMALMESEMAPLIERFEAENEALEAQEKVVVDLVKGYEAFQREMRSTDRLVGKASEVVGDLRQELSGAEQALSKFLNAPLQGQYALSDAAFANSQAIAALQLRLNRLTLNGDDLSDEADEIRAKIERLQLVGSNLQLTEQLTIGQQRHELEQLARLEEEITFSEAASGIQDAVDSIRDLTDQLVPAEEELARLVELQESQQATAEEMATTLEAAQESYAAQAEVVGELGQAIGGIQTVMEEFGARQSEIVSAAISEFSDLAAAAREAAAAAAGDGPGVTPPDNTIAGDMTPLAPFDLSGMRASAQQTVADIMGSFNSLDLSGATAEFQGMAADFGRQMDTMITGVAAVVGARGLGTLIGRSAVLGNTMSAGAASGVAMAGALIGVGVAMYQIEQGSERGTRRATEFIDALDRPTTFAALAESMNTINARIGETHDASGNFFTAWTTGAQTNIAENQALVAEWESLNTMMLALSEHSRALGSEFGFNATSVADLALKLGVDFVNNADGADAAMRRVLTAADILGIGIDGLSANQARNLSDMAQGVIDFNQQMEDNFASSTNIVEQFANDSEVTAQELTDYYAQMANDSTEWAGLMDQLAASGPGSGITQAMLQELAAAGPSSLPLVRTLWEMVQNGSFNGILASQQHIANAFGHVRDVTYNQLVGGFYNTGWNMGWQQVQGTIDSVRRFGPNIAQAFLDSIPAVGVGITGSSSNPGLRVIIGQMANGGLVDSAQLALIGEAGPEAVIPLTRPARALELMKESGLLEFALGQFFPRYANGGVVGNASGVIGDGGIDMGGIVGRMSEGSSGGTTVVNKVEVTIEGSVVTERKLIDAVHEGLTKKSKRNGGVPFERTGAA